MKIRITLGMREGEVLEAGSPLEASNLLGECIKNNEEWVFDSSELETMTEEEEWDWAWVDFISRCYRAIEVRRLPVVFRGKKFRNVHKLDEEIHKANCWVRVNRDDEEVGVELEVVEYRH